MKVKTAKVTRLYDALIYSDREIFMASLFSEPIRGQRFLMARAVYKTLEIEAGTRALTPAEKLVQKYIKSADFFKSKYPVFDFRKSWIKEYADIVLEDRKLKDEYLVEVYRHLNLDIPLFASKNYPVRKWLERELNRMQTMVSKKGSPNSTITHRPIWKSTQANFIRVMVSFFELMKKLNYVEDIPDASHLGLYFQFAGRKGNARQLSAQEIRDLKAKVKASKLKPDEKTKRIASALLALQ